MAKQQAVGMGREDLESGGFLNDRACQIDEAEATTGTSKSGKGGERPVVRLLMTVEGMDEQVERNLSVGKGLLPSDDGKCFFPDKDADKPAKGIKKSSNYGRFLESLYEADTDGKLNIRDITADLPGIIFRALEVEEPGINEGDPNRRILTVAELLDAMPEAEDKPKGKKEPKPAKDKDDDADPIAESASEHVLAALGAKSPLKLEDLPKLVLRAAAGDKNRKAVVAKVQDVGFLMTIEGAKVSKQKGTITLVEEE